MTPPTARQIQQAADDYGRRLSQRLDDGTAGDLPYDLSERLRAARMQAVAARRQPQRAVAAVGASPAVAGRTGGTLVLGGGDGGRGRGPVWRQALASALPVLALVAGLVVVSDMLDDERAREVAEVDAALLTDALPPEAYTDAGFLQFLKSGAPAGSLDADADTATTDGTANEGGPLEPPDAEGEPAAAGEAASLAAPDAPDAATSTASAAPR